MGNLERVRAAMRAKGLSAMLLSEIGSVQWASGFTGTAGWVLLTPDDGVFVTDSRYTLQAREEVADLPVVTFGSPTDGATALGEQVARLGIQSLGFESDSVTVETWTKWKAKFGSVELVPSPEFVAPLRMVKTPAEIDKIRQACAAADACFEHVKRMIQPGVREYDIALDIEFFFRRQGMEVAFPVIAVSGAKSARPHGKPGEKVLERGDFVTLDFGAKVDGYCSDITRTVVVVEASDRHREIYSQVLKAETAAIEAMRPGARASDIDALARRVLDEKDLARYFGHGLGHGLGRLVHDAGRMNATSETILEVGQVWTVEPGVYIEGFGGVRIEDDVVVTENGVEVLTHAPKELLLLPIQECDRS
ncbi:MAG: Xaa-Pro peptidase family protein [Fimbriimonadaceae bacterium]|nr:aminopeptidase P family protein [Chthonomonadaceae bacterium]MCO5296102.1 Xaa-Pro peptidase family protein [Fimbriimonadaceae bacterium]